MTAWDKLSGFPVVSPWNKGRRSYTWEQRRNDYAALPKTPLIISARLATPVVHAEPGITHLDSIITSAAITSHPVASRWGRNVPAVVPLPFELLWVSDDGLPLWACTPLMANLPGIDGREYWHKRYPTDRADFGKRLSANTTSGRWREYRVPMPVQSVGTLHALAIGNAAEIERLLAYITHIGKKGSAGYGRVAQWSVTESSHTVDDIMRLRPIPVASGLVAEGAVKVRPWTPPYWYAPWWSECFTYSIET